MKTTIEFSTDILDQYSDFERANENWNILSYLNYKYDINAALAFSKLFLPDFVCFKNCVILSFLFNERTANEWYIEFSGEIKSVEKMCNLYELKDFFHINSKYTNESLEILGNALVLSWKLNLRQAFPEKDFQVDVFEEYDSLYITFYQNV